MKQPTHPGKIIRQELEALDVTITAAADALGVSRQQLTNLVNEKAGISPEMAIRLEKCLGSTAQTWLSLWTQFELAQAMKVADAMTVHRLSRA